MAKFLKIIPVDNKGRLGCYNECATFFLKQDTLITICGGYTFYWVKAKPIIKEYKGKGSNTFQVVLPGANHTINIVYNFYNEPGQLIIEDQSGKQLFATIMEATNGERKIKILIDKVSKLTFKIKSGKSNSVWMVKTMIE